MLLALEHANSISGQIVRAFVVGGGGGLGPSHDFGPQTR